MFLDFLIKLKESKLPVSLNEFLTFLDSLKLDIIEYDIDHGNLVLEYPLNYSFRIQYIDGNYYVPNKAEGSKKTLWYVI